MITFYLDGLMFQYLPYDDIKLNNNVTLYDILNGYFIECDLKYPDEIKEKTKYFPFAPENKLSPID